jgi:4-amino-4-deoxy-L-arabinose transferase-like glycosyltransferase
MPDNNACLWKHTPALYPVAGLCLLWLLLRAGSFVLSQNYSFDAVSRTIIAENWARQPNIIPGNTQAQPTQYAPLPIYFMGLSLMLWNNPFISPRLISLLFSLLILLPFYHLVRLRFGQRDAFYASLFLAFFSLHIKSGVVASSETIFCFFLLCGIYLVCKYKCRWQKIYLVGGAFFMNLAALSRYTGLLYIFLLALILLDRKRFISSLGDGFLFCGLSLILPGLWFWLHQINFAEGFYPLKFIMAEHQAVTSGLHGVVSRLYFLSFWPGVLALSLTPGLAGLSVLGIYDCLRQKIHLDIILLIIGIYLFFMYRSVIAADLFLMPRFVIDSGILMLPFAMIGMDKLQPLLPQPWRSHFPAAVLLSVILWILLVIALSHSKVQPLAEKMRAVSPLSELEASQQEIISFLRHEKPQGDIIIDHNPTWSELEIMFYSSLPQEHFGIGLHQYREHPAYLILLPRGEISQKITHQGLDSLSQCFGMRAGLLFSNAGYSLYKLSPAVFGQE